MIEVATESELNSLHQFLMSFTKKAAVPEAKALELTESLKREVSSPKAKEIFAAIQALLVKTGDLVSVSKDKAKWVPSVGTYWWNSRK